MTLYFIRHLPTIWNKKGLLQGQKDLSICNVSKNNEIQIIENKINLNKINLDCTLVSELKRTKETSIAYKYYNYQSESLLNELNFGKYEGKLKTKMLREIGTDWYENVNKVVLGESLKIFEKRLILFIAKYNQSNNILVFGHGAVCRALKCLSINGNINKMNRIEVKNNELTIINFN